MSTLSNEQPEMGKGIAPSGRIKPDTHSTSTLSNNSNTLTRNYTDRTENGESVRYAHTNIQWFVLRATYGRALKAQNILNNHGFESYIPIQYKYKFFNKKKKLVKSPFLPNLIFVHTTIEDINFIVKNLCIDGNGNSWLNIYYNHFATKEQNSDKNPPLTIDDSSMENFIRVTSIKNEHIMIASPEQCHYKSGDIVEVIDGEFKGIVGKIARFAGQQRVIVNLEGVCLLATAYIPTGFIKIHSKL